jgi:hypothetical protein
MSQPPKQPIRRPAPPRPERPPQKERPARPDVDYSSLPKSQPQNSNFAMQLTECENAIKNMKCVVFRVTASWCGTCKKADFTSASNKLKELADSMPNVKYYDFDWDRDLSVIGMLEIIETTVPYFKVFHNGKLVKTYSGTTHMKELEKDVVIYSQ